MFSDAISIVGLTGISGAVYMERLWNKERERERETDNEMRERERERVRERETERETDGENEREISRLRERGASVNNIGSN